MGSLRQIYRLGIFIVLCITVQLHNKQPKLLRLKSNRTNYKNKHTDTSSNHTTYTTSKKRSQLPQVHQEQTKIQI